MFDGLFAGQGIGRQHTQHRTEGEWMMIPTKQPHTTPLGLNVMALLLVLAALVVAFGCWFDDEIHRHTERSGAAYHGLSGVADTGHALGSLMALDDAADR